MGWWILKRSISSAHLTTAPGVYQFYDASDNVLYVGKARNLKKRVSSYFQKTLNSPRLTKLVQQTTRVDVVVTHSENEALLLENQLIKKLKPRYNILMRDDKSYPYIVISKHEFPRLGFQRGDKKPGQHYFGPYPGVVAMRETLRLVQKIFRLRVCRDSFFAHRSRPCLLYQIKKCTAPCVNLISKEQYQENVHAAMALLNGKNEEVMQRLIKRMEIAADKQNYELAAQLRDQVASLRQIQAPQVIDTNRGNVDVFAVIIEGSIAAVQLLVVRHGQLLGNKTFYPKLPDASSASEILAAFIPQYYLTREIPSKIIVNHMIADQTWLANALSDMAKHTVIINKPSRSVAEQWIKMAEQTAKQALINQVSSHANYRERLNDLQKALQLTSLPMRLECFDISHSSGEATVASCVVFDQAGPLKNAYRRFNIEHITAADDYAALYQAISRRLKDQTHLPQVLFIDGGKGQLTQGIAVLKELNISDVLLVAIAKGVTRKPGFEQLFLPGKKVPLMLSPDSPALHLIQQIRDEAHRFAITGHRSRRAKTRQHSLLEDIPGIGAKRRRELLRYFGGLQELKRAGVGELTKVPGISASLAEKIYEALH